MISNLDIQSISKLYSAICRSRVTIPARLIGKWILIQQNLDDSVLFNRPWSDFKQGFGAIAKNYWMGFDSIRGIMAGTDYRLRVEVQTDSTGRWYSAEYDVFSVGTEQDCYPLTVSGYSGDVTVDTLSRLNGVKFSAYDRVNTPAGGAGQNCAAACAAGWWYDGGGGACCDGTAANLNAPAGGNFTFSAEMIRASRMMMIRQ